MQPEPPRAPLPLRLGTRQLLGLEWTAAAAYGVLAWGLFAHKISPGWFGVAVTVAAAAAIGLCRRWPMAAAGSALMCFWVSPWSATAAFVALPPLALALYRIAAHARTRIAATVGVLALTGPLATGLPDFSRAGGVVPFAMSVVIAWTVGYAVGQRRGYAQEVFVHQLVQQRMGLARELHDVVAHSMSVIAVQAGYGHLVGPDKPDQAFAALAVIESTSRQTLTELRQLLGVLRQGATDPPLIPTPGVADIDRLIEQAAAGGVRVSLRTSGDLDLVPAGVGLAAYRIVQESLTNVIKHAGTGTAQVRISCDGGGLLIEVTDDGGGRDDRTGSDGHGLVGMRERAAMYGGWVRARPVAGHGFHVVAQLPLNGTAA